MKRTCDVAVGDESIVALGGFVCCVLFGFGVFIMDLYLCTILLLLLLFGVVAGSVSTSIHSFGVFVQSNRVASAVCL